MILIWRGWGLLAVVALFPLLASCGGLITVEPLRVFAAAASVSLLIGGATCVHYGTRWNRPVVEHSFYFIPLQVWGWVYLAIVAVPAALVFVAGFGQVLGVFPPNPNEHGPHASAYMALAGGAALCAVLGTGYALVRSARAPGGAPADRGER